MCNAKSERRHGPINMCSRCPRIAGGASRRNALGLYEREECVARKAKQTARWTNINVGRTGDRLYGMGDEMGKLEFDILSTPSIEPFSFSCPLNTIYIYVLS